MDMRNEATTTAFKKASFKKMNPRQLLADIMDAFPDGPEDVWRKEFWTRVNKQHAYLLAVVDWWLDNNLIAVTRDRPSEAGDNRVRKVVVHKDAMQSTLGAHIERQAKIMLLDLAMPNGKELRHCTGAECKGFGGWLSALGDKVGKRREVGSAMNEASIRSFYDKHMSE